MSKMMCIICLHLKDDLSLPCIQFNDLPPTEIDSGKTFLCLDCSEREELKKKEIVAVCDGCVSRMNIVETIDELSFDFHALVEDGASTPKQDGIGKTRCRPPTR